MHNDELTANRWRKSTYSNGSGGCVAVCEDIPNVTPIHDTTDPSGPSLYFPATSFTAFVQGLKNGTFGTV
jgi:hypothetical protein